MTCNIGYSDSPKLLKIIISLYYTGSTIKYFRIPIPWIHELQFFQKKIKYSKAQMQMFRNEYACNIYIYTFTKGSDRTRFSNVKLMCAWCFIFEIVNIPSSSLKHYFLSKLLHFRHMSNIMHLHRTSQNILYFPFEMIKRFSI